MTAPVFQTGRAFQYWVVRFALLNALSAVAWAVVYATSIIHFSGEQLTALFKYLTLVVGVALAIATVAVFRMTEGTARYLDASRAGRVSPDVARSGFRSLMELPGAMFALALVLWAVFGGALALLMRWRVESFTNFGALTICIAAASGGLVSQIFSYVWVKQRLSELREELAGRIEVAAERAALVRRIPLTAKLYVAVLGLVVVLTAFSLSLAQVRTTERGDAEWVRLGQDVLASLEAAVQAGRDPDSWIQEAGAWLPESAVRLVLLDAGLPSAELPGPGSGGENSRGLAPKVVEEILAHPEGGSRLDADAQARVTWRRLPDQNRLAVVVSPRTASRGGVVTALRDYGLLGCFIVLVAALLVSFVARDLKRAAAVLNQEMKRVASGDLRPGRVFESEDEFGGLARSFSDMAASLRQAVGRISEIADHVEEATGKIAASSGAVRAVSLEQVEGIQSATVTMENIHSEAAGISTAARALGESVDRSSAAIVQLEGSGKALSGSAATLTENVDEVVSSIAEMGVSLRSVAEQAETLNDSAAFASKSMENMASSVRDADTSAKTAADLSDGMVSVAERGREKVQQTIAGIEAIRGATESAEVVIRSLVGHSQEIGTILEVIDAVADETGLLALNAAIIAAQAGEQGRGFKVVADEVKQLAQRVLASTKEITQLIEAVQSESSNAVKAIRESVERVEEGATLSAEAGSSLEEITRAAQESGQRVAEVVSGIAEHSRAASEVIELMQRVNRGVEQIRLAGQGQQAASNVALRSSSVMAEVADLVRGAAEEQAQTVSQISEGAGTVRGSTARINQALGEQTDNCGSAVKLLGGLRARTLTNEQSTDSMEEAVKGLSEQAEALREDLRRFKL